MNIAVIGTGISGLGAAWLLNKEHDIQVYETRARRGGHTATVDVEVPEGTFAIDTGFIVFNDWTYPNFIKLMDHLGVPSQPSHMSFSVRCDTTGLEYNGADANTFFAQRRNLLRPTHWRMLRDIMRFNESIKSALQDGSLSETITLGEYLKANNYGDTFVRYYIIPMGSAIWSSSVDEMMAFPLYFFARFFNNHGMLNMEDRPTWRVIKGGSREYVAPLTADFEERIHLDCAVTSVRRVLGGVELEFSNGETDYVDQVVFACHSDQALALIHAPREQEQAVLGAIPYKANDVILHTDSALLPRKKRAWAAWNYHVTKEDQKAATLTYNMNILQGLDCDTVFNVSLNCRDTIAPHRIIDTFSYSHPVFTVDGIAAQQQWSTISNVDRFHFCGAYWRNGFHEDGLWSAIRVAEAFGISFDDYVTADASASMSSVAPGASVAPSSRSATMEVA